MELHGILRNSMEFHGTKSTSSASLPPPWPLPEQHALSRRTSRTGPADRARNRPPDGGEPIPRADLRRLLEFQVFRGVEHVLLQAGDALGGLGFPEEVQHHLTGADGGQRVDDILAGVFRRTASPGHVLRGDTSAYHSDY